MMYLQITTKCNMTCDHCCMAATKWGRHGDKHLMLEAIQWASNYDDQFITIGGGEPTNHPDFFEILRKALDYFGSVLVITNGSNAQAMHRLQNILQDCDYDDHDDDCRIHDCTCEEDGEECYCMDYCECAIYSNGKLEVEVSSDYFHDRSLVQDWVFDAFPNRDVSRRVLAVGRAKETGAGWEEGCACETTFISPTGQVKQCGCLTAPRLGHFWEDPDFVMNGLCYRGE